MLSFFKKFLSPPKFLQDDDKTRAAAILNPLLLGAMLFFIFFTLIQGFTGAKTYGSITTIIFASLSILSIGLWFLMKRGFVRLAGYVFVTMGWIALTIQAWTYSGLRDIAIVAYAVVILAAGLLIGFRSSIGYAIISLLASWVFAYLETIGKYNGLGDSPYPTAIELTIIFALVALISYVAVNNINQALKISRISEQELRSNNQELHVLRGDLEKRVSERTLDLEKRTSEIQAASLIARDTSIGRDLDVMLDRAAQLIKDKFGYYHTGIYLIDNNGENVILRAAGGEIGTLMMRRKYKVTVGEFGIIGNVAQTGVARIVLDVASETSYFKNPLLPYTRSEMAIPLRVANRIIGILDIQSDKANAFDQASISIIQIVTDQLSISIERNQLLRQLQENATALEQALQENTSRSWRSFLERNRGQIGFHYDGVSIESLSGSSSEPAVLGQELGKVSIPNIGSDKPNKVLSVPIQLRGQALGTLTLKFHSTEASKETIKLVEEAANRLALALENARLIQDAQRLALRERQINLISAQAQQSPNLEMLLQNTVKELGNALGMPNTFIQIGLVDSDSKDE
jgi:GAF domain-containing protein